MAMQERDILEKKEAVEKIIQILKRPNAAYLDGESRPVEAIKSSQIVTFESKRAMLNDIVRSKVAPAQVEPVENLSNTKITHSLPLKGWHSEMKDLWRWHYAPVLPTA